MNIAIIGSGQLGSRHLQALAGLREPASIQVVDSSTEALVVAQQRFEQVAKDFTGSVAYLNEIGQLSTHLDVVIVATGSNSRKSVVFDLLTRKKVRYLILEKFLFPRLEEYDLVAELLQRSSTKSWVNCPRRMIPYYRRLRSSLNGQIRMDVVGNDWGLGCNGIHMFDLFAFLVGTSSISLVSHLNKTIKQSKRAGYIEFTGTINGSTEDGHTISLTSFDGDPSPSTIAVSDVNNRYVLFENSPQSTVLHSSKQNDWKWETSTYAFPFQSQLTHLVVNDLVNSGDCQLTPYAESSIIHSTCLRTFTEFMKALNPKIAECLIT